MKLIKLFSLALLLPFFGNNINAQIYAKNAYIYVADNYVFTKGNVNLDTGGNIFLRNESQLLQSTTNTSTNTGVGKLSAFQEGTVNAYKYNYWCSPVGNASASSGNENFGITMLNRPVDKIISIPAITTTQTGYNGVSNPLAVEPYWIWKYLSSDGYNLGGPNGWLHVQAASTLSPGQGFTMKGTGGIDSNLILGVQNNIDGKNQRYDFRGKPNDGNIDVLVAKDKNTLTGNPYPSAIDLSAFLLSATNGASNTDRIAYFWEQNKAAVDSHNVYQYEGGYGSFSPVSLATVGVYLPATFLAYNGFGTSIGASGGSGVNYERRFCPIGQGFMLLGNNALVGVGTVQMNNSFRVFKKEGVVNNSQFERSSNRLTFSDFLDETPSVSGFDYTTVSKLPVPQIRIKTVVNDLTVQQLALAFDNNATDGIDSGMDAGSVNTDNQQEIYFLIDDKTFGIDIINFDINKKIPLGLRNVADANFKISMHEMLNFYDSEHVYIHDKLNDTYFDITQNTFEVNMPAGTNNARFEITFMPTSVLATDSITIKDFNVIQNNATSLLTIINSKSIDLKEVNIYDITGKLILSKNKLGTDKSYQISTSGLSDAIYIVKVVTANGEIQGKKILVYYNKTK